MADGRTLPTRVAGGPIPGEPTVTEWLPMGLQRGLPAPLGQALATLFARRDRVGHVRGLLRGAVSDADALGIRGGHHPALPGRMHHTPWLARLRDHTAPLLHPSQAVDLRSMAARPPAELRGLGRLGHVLHQAGGARGYTVVEPNDGTPALATALGEVRAHRQGWLVGADGVGTAAAYAIAKAARLLGVRHLDSSGRLHDGTTADVLAEAWGPPATGASLADLARADLVLLWGVQAADAPGLLDLLAAARDGGTRVVTLDAVHDLGFRPPWLPSQPMGTLFGTRLVDDALHLPRGGEVALVGAVLEQLHRWGVVDAAPRGATPAPMPAQQVEWLAQLLARAGTVMSVWGPGLALEAHGADAARAVVTLHRALGAHGRPGTGVIGLRHAANAQGHDDVGLSATRLPGGQPHTVARAKALGEAWGHPVRQQPGAPVLEQLRMAAEGELDLLVMVGDPLADLPLPLVRDALGKVPRRVHLVSHLDPTLAVPAPLDGQVWVLPVHNSYDSPEPTWFTSVDGRIARSPSLPTRPTGGERVPAWRRVVAAVRAAKPEVADALAWPTLDAVVQELASQVPDHEGIEALGPERPSRTLRAPRRAFVDADPVLPAPPPAVAAGYRLVFRDGHAVPGGARWADRANGLDRDHIGLSSADAHREGLADGDPCVLVTTQGRLAGRARVVDIAPGHAWVAWPEAATLMVVRAQPETGALDRTTVATLQVP